MSATTLRIPLADAERNAAELVELLKPACVRIEVAGSIRRKRPDVGDLDIVAIPYVRHALNLFGEPIPDSADDALHATLSHMAQENKIAARLDANGRRCWGRDLKRAIYRGLNVDIQAVHDGETWGTWLLIRTGPAEFTKRIVTPRHQGGLLPPGCQFKDGFRLYRYGGRVPMTEEGDVFAALGLGWIEPEERR
jgi:DNA polymerase/3'-5' exonuclease PolX